MIFAEIRELTIIGNNVVIDGEEYKVTSTLENGINAVQYHKGRPILEETDTAFIEVAEAKYQHFLDEWVTAKNQLEAERVARENQLEAERLANQPTETELVQMFATNAIGQAIQNEVDIYNKANGIALGNVHNAESYSRVPTYTHRAFCEAVWLWSVELWEFMRAWQDTLTGLPTEQEILDKIAEKPFTFAG